MKTNVVVRIMENDFQLACNVDERDNLVKSAEYLNTHLKSFRRSNPSLDVEKLLLMGALKVTCELMEEITTLSDQAKIANGEIKKVLDAL